MHQGLAEAIGSERMVSNLQYYSNSLVIVSISELEIYIHIPEKT